jgi:hypothetical protein
MRCNLLETGSSLVLKSIFKCSHVCGSLAHNLRCLLVFAVAAACVMFSGCGDQYRPVLSATNPVGPAAQPAKYAVAVSSASATSNGLLTLVDFSGDSTLITATLGVNPYYFNLSTGGTTGFTLNSDGSLNSFDVSTSLLSNEILTTTLLP